jgi:hypothetical protein
MRPPKPTRPGDLECPGLKWRERSDGWVAYWVARADIRDRGWPIATRQMWDLDDDGEPWREPTREEWEFMADECGKLQDEMLAWSPGERGRDDATSIYDGSWKSLIDIFLSDQDSPFQELRAEARAAYARRCRVLIATIGQVMVGTTSLRDLNRWYMDFKLGGKTRAYMLMVQIRLVVSFGKALRLAGVKEVQEILEEVEFRGGRKKRTVFMTAQQAVDLRAEAHRQGYPSIALAQALMFELGVRQKDTIGEIVGLEQPGLSDVILRGGKKWLMGFRWDAVDPATMILRHRLSKSVRGLAAVADMDEGKTESFPLRAYPMVMEELERVAAERRVGPMIVHDRFGVPWRRKSFGLRWRAIARAAGIPDEVQNRDSRAGATTEGSKAGATIEQLRKQVAHSRTDTTLIYVRTDVEDREEVAQMRVERRKNMLGER